MRFQLRLFGRFFTTFMLLMAFAVSGFAHSNMAERVSPELAEYVANGGSIADICGNEGGEHSPNLMKCESCRLINSAAMPDAAFLLPEIQTSQTRRFLLVARIIHQSRPLDPSRLTRAPPQA
ncbi:MAG: hypothetical protein ABJN34_01010 [Litoreibacter sp.]|uniref:hypothetical protein n=1 Tax=Litoreibacter sp. TaxID=1969459 RepID=UPI0032990EEC